MKRSSGILMPVSSLPAPVGIGTLGREAYDFVDFLKAAGQEYWEILPLNPVGYGDSPYQSASAFAFNPLFVDPEILKNRGLLTGGELCEAQNADTPGTIDYGELFQNRYTLLKKAIDRLEDGDENFEQYKAENSYWLSDYALFKAYQEAHDFIALKDWPADFKNREAPAMDRERIALAQEIHYHEAMQFLFYQQWCELKKYANSRGIKIIGDVPIYVDLNSADLWSNPSLFLLDENKDPSVVAGLPPDGFAPGGQKWGNPIYDWEQHKRTGYGWWLRRLRHAFSLYDAVRIDHFRGFAGYYAIPADHKNAVYGSWHKGPGRDIVNAINQTFPGRDIIAEDLGAVTDDVRDLRKASGFMGIKILQFAFDDREWAEFLPHNYERNSVIYTGNHDNATTAEWLRTAPKEYIDYAKEYLDLHEDSTFVRNFIKRAMETVCDLAIIPIQDWLELGEEARINVPGSMGGWRWRLNKGMMTEKLAAEIRRCSTIYGRCKKR